MPLLQNFTTPILIFSRNVRLSERQIATLAHRDFLLLRLINTLTYLLTYLLISFLLCCTVFET